MSGGHGHVDHHGGNKGVALLSVIGFWFPTAVRLF